MTMRGEKGSALLVALLALALAGAGAAILAELGRLALVRVRLDRDGVRAWFVAEAGLADTLGAITPGTTFSDHLADEPALTALDPPWAYTARFVDDADDDPDDRRQDTNTRVSLHVTATGPAPIRRRLEAVIGRNPDPYMPGAATLAGGVRELAHEFRLDGRDFAMDGGCTVRGAGRDRAGLVVPEGAEVPPLTDPGQVEGRNGPPSIAHAAAPDLTGLADHPDGTRRPGGLLTGTLGTPSSPQFTIVTGDAVAEAGTQGAGVLYVTGRLRITGAFHFIGVVAAASGVEVAPAGDLALCGALWAGGEPALDALGRGTVRASTDTLRWAATIAPLPAQARLVAARELY